MSKKSIIARQIKREKLVMKYAEKRKMLKAAGDYEALDKLPKNASPVRLRNRCRLTGRPRGYLRLFGISRLQFRDLAANGKVPGIRKSSW
jgi:small subunit ribosomal protein S14